MKILVLTTSYPSCEGDFSGGFIHSLAKALARRGHELRVLVPGRVDVLGRRTIDGIDVHHFRYALTRGGHGLTTIGGGIPEALRRSRLSALRIPALMARFACAAARESRWADVIWANWLGAALAGAAPRIGSRRPMVLTLRGDDAYLIHDRPLWRKAGRYVFNRCAAVTAVSANMAALLEGLLPPQLGPVLVPTFGVDTELFCPAKEQNAAPPRGLFVGNISRAKGVDTLLRSLARCEVPWRFAFVGSGPDLQAMQQLDRELELGDNVQWLGQRSVTEIPALMRESDFLVLPSRSEGRPNVIMEAMASGLPVIATAVGSVPDMIRDGVTGLLVPVDDEAALAAAIARLCSEADLRRSLAAAARQHILDANLSWDRTAAEFEAIFQKAIGKRP